MQYVERHYLEANPAIYLDYALGLFTPPIGIGKPGAAELVLITYERYEALLRAARRRRTKEEEELEALLLEAISEPTFLTDEVMEQGQSEWEEPDYPPVPPGLMELSWMHDDEDVYVPVEPSKTP